MSVTVRHATVPDSAVVGRLLFDFNTEFGSNTPDSDVLATRFARLLERKDVCVLLAEDSSGPFGFAYLTVRPTPYHDGTLAQLEELYVAPALRATGIGSAVLTAAIDHVQQLGAREVHINVDEIDEDTRRFYERHGFWNVEPGAEHRMLCYIREF